MAGYPCDVKNISKFCKNKGLTLIEDCAHAVGTKIDNKHVKLWCFRKFFILSNKANCYRRRWNCTNNKSFYKKIKTCF